MLILDCSQRGCLSLVHSMKLVKTPGSGGFCKQLQLDLEKNLLLCRMSTGVIYFIQLFQAPNEQNASIIEAVDSYKGNEDEKISRFCWISRLDSYVEGTNLGHLRVREISNRGDCML